MEKDRGITIINVDKQKQCIIARVTCWCGIDNTKL